MSALGNPVYRFKGFELEPAERRLSEAGRAIALTPKVFDTLVLLVQRAGHVVSKDELMRALWPRGYVDESNLTKHIWFIRRALGGGEQDSRFIETVSKVGYRFVAPVSMGWAGPQGQSGAQIGPAGPAADPSARGMETARESGAAEPAQVAPGVIDVPAASPPRGTAAGAASRRRVWLVGLAGLAALMIVAAGVRRLAMIPAATTATAAAPGHDGHTVALIGFSNLSRNAKDAWLEPALTEMLGTELNAAQSLRVVPDELVQDASVGLPPPAAGGYAPLTLARLRRRLGADYIVSGSYLVMGSADEAPLRVDIALQDARDGALLASVSNQADDSELIALVQRMGAMLRNRLGAGTADAAPPGLVAGQQPPSVDVARRMGLAIDALQHFDAARARDELLEAVAEAPGYAPAYTRLAQAWSALGYHDKALAAAEQAASNAGGLPPEQRLLAEAVVEAVRPDWNKAVAAWRALALLKPQNPEYRLRLIEAEVAAGMVPAARAELAELLRLPGGADDPRAELAAAEAARAGDDVKAAAGHAANALQLAQQHDLPALAADARVALAGSRMHLNENEQARTELEEAIADYRSVGNPHGEAAARDALARVLGNLNRGHDAREEYQRAMALYQGIGDVAGVAGVYRDLCSLLWVAGDRDGAQAAAQHSLELARQTDDLPLQAWTLRALATIAADAAAGDDILNEYREVIALNERSGNRGGHVWSLAAYADVERLRGDLDDALRVCRRASAEAAALSDPQFAIYSGFTCALVEMDLGMDSQARAELQTVMRLVGTGGDTTYLNDSLMSLAQLDMDDDRWAAALTRLQAASRGFAAADEQTGEADAEAMLALCGEALGDTAGREAASGRARKLRQSITSRQEIYFVDIALARLDDAQDDPSVAPERLLALATDADRRHFLNWALEARLAAWELLHARHAAGAEALRREVEATARQHGYGRVLRLVGRGRSARASPRTRIPLREAATLQ